MKKTKTSKKDFELFKKHCLKYLEAFGLKEFRIEFEHNEFEDARAWIDFYKNGSVVNLGLSKDWNKDEVTEERIECCAFHEVCELLLGNLHMLIIRRFISEDDIECELHKVIRRLENFQFGLDKN